MNKVFLIGHLGRDAETRQAGASTVTSFSVATSRRWKDQSGEFTEETDWTNVVLWNADKLSPYLTKGKQVCVQGRIQTRTYDDKDGKKCYATEVVADDVLLLGGRGQEEESQAEPASRAPLRRRSDTIDDTGLPF